MEDKVQLYIDRWKEVMNKRRGYMKGGDTNEEKVNKKWVNKRLWQIKRGYIEEGDDKLKNGEWRKCSVKKRMNNIHTPGIGWKFKLFVA